MAAPSSNAMDVAREKWEEANNVQTVDVDSVYRYDHAAYLKQREERPWKQEYVLHARAGGKSSMRQQEERQPVILLSLIPH